MALRIGLVGVLAVVLLAGCGGSRTEADRDGGHAKAGDGQSKDSNHPPIDTKSFMIGKWNYHDGDANSGGSGIEYKVDGTYESYGNMSVCKGRWVPESYDGDVVRVRVTYTSTLLDGSKAELYERQTIRRKGADSVEIHQVGVNKSGEPILNTATGKPVTELTQTYQRGK